MCGRKRSYRTRFLAQQSADHAKTIRNTVLRIYECPLCCLWHLTKKPESQSFCECGKKLDPFLPPESSCKKCEVNKQKRGIQAVCQIMDLLSGRRTTLEYMVADVFGQFFSIFKRYTYGTNKSPLEQEAENNQRVAEVFAQLFSVFRRISVVSQGPSFTEDFSVSLNRALVYLMRKQGSSSNG